MTEIKLRSLAPEYQDDHHKIYVSRLNAAVSDPRNKNIALTGRYGSGKSSILDDFIQGQESLPALVSAPKAPGYTYTEEPAKKNGALKQVLRISINTLGPDEGDDLTNRIQKELVKQLVYRAKPGEVRRSEFARAPELTRWRAGFEALVVAVAIVGLLWLFGLRPKEDSMGTDGFLLPMVAFSFIVFMVLWAIRWYVGNRVVAEVSAGGASIALEGKNDSFFDKYLDELIAFFEATEPDIVVFEDLDRFDDPRIFDSLRELNTLVNTSVHWRSRPNRPLRFVYAIKDSLFEKLGDEQQEKDASGASMKVENSDPSPGPEAKVGQKKQKTTDEALERANRTKFFEIVIPVVSFLSHSNARDHFLGVLEDLELPKGTDLDHGLIDIVARHTTDMRLMINIGNEFVVYAEHLLWVEEDKRAPGLTANLLFALVVYKNFHLTDFEALPHRGSALDALDRSRRKLVDDSIKSLQIERSALLTGVTRQEKQQDLAMRLGRRLDAMLTSVRMSLHEASAGDTPLNVEMTGDRSFWEPVGRAGTIAMTFHKTNYGVFEGPRLTPMQFKDLFPEAADPNEWQDASSTVADLLRISEIDSEIATLRRADFEVLINDPRYSYNGQDFGTIAQHDLPSDVALDLVTQGHIDRFYAEYATVFYGKFLGVDVAKFFRNNVWPNEMDMQFHFMSDGAVKNVLEHAPVDFLRTRSALNIEIVNYLMDAGAASSTDLIVFLARTNDKAREQFLRTYFKTPESHSAALVSLLAAEPWPDLFTFIASEGTVDTDETNIELLNAALLNARKFERFEFDDLARALVRRLHTEIPAFRDTQTQSSTTTRFAFLTAALPSIPSLRAISPELQELAVSTKQYDLSAVNIRTAAKLSEGAPISADNLVEQPDVWAYCAENLDAYLDLIEEDESTSWSCLSPEVLAQVVNTQHEKWSTGLMKLFLGSSAESAVVPDITIIREGVRQAVVGASRVIPSFENIAEYVADLGVDVELAQLLTDDDGAVVDIVGLEHAVEEYEEQFEYLILALLNAQEVLDPRPRVLLAKQLCDVASDFSLDPNEVVVSPDALLAELLREGLVDDDVTAFGHFAGGGWPSIGPALKQSANAAEFITPALVQGHATELVQNQDFPERTRRVVLERLTDFAPVEGPAFLKSAAAAARTLRVQLSVEALSLVAPAVDGPADVVWQLHEQDPAIPAFTVKQILGSMPGSFAGFAKASGEEFEVEDVALLRTVLDRLKDANEITFQTGRQPKGRWKLRIT